MAPADRHPAVGHEALWRVRETLRRARDPHVRHVQEQLDRWDDLSHRERRARGRVLAALAESAEGSAGLADDVHGNVERERGAEAARPGGDGLGQRSATGARGTARLARGRGDRRS